MKPALTNALAWLARPVDAASLGLFRILFGLCMLYSYLDYIRNGGLHGEMIAPRFHFRYPGLEWVSDPSPGLVVGAIVGFSLLLALGLLTRLASLGFLVSYVWWFLSDAAYYNNHYYLICLLGGLFLVTNPERWGSVDSRIWPRPAAIPAWQLYIFRFQLIVVYFYGGLAKLNADWLRGIPVKYWLAERAASRGLDFLAWPATTTLVTTAGILIDLTAPFLLLWRRTRWLGLALMVGFHLANSYLFSIGIFPWLMLAALVLFLEPDAPRRWLRRPPLRLPEPRPLPALVVACLLVYAVVQLLLPLRHLVRGQDVAWDEDGHLWSWRMKLRDKNGAVGFVLLDRGQLSVPHVHADLTAYQVRRIQGRPDLIRQYARHLAEKTGCQVLIWTWTSLNRRPCQTLLDQEGRLFPFLDLQFPPPGPANLVLAIDQRQERGVEGFYHVDLLDAQNHPVGSRRVQRDSSATRQFIELSGLPAGRFRLLVLALSPGGLVLTHSVADCELQSGDNRFKISQARFIPGPPLGLISGAGSSSSGPNRPQAAP
ncbi:MAG: hypothetical protein AMXMBFR33_29810 [Candidatus Xenobia bacterium]